MSSQVVNTHSFTHDQLCPSQDSTALDFVISCDDCDLIAQVRADGNAKHTTRKVFATAYSYNAGYDAALADVSELVNAFESLGTSEQLLRRSDIVTAINTLREKL